MTIVGWRLIHYKHTQQRESLLVPFGKWFRDLGWLFAWTFGGDGVYDIIHSDMKGVGKLLIAAVLLFAIKKGRKIKNALVKNKGTANNAFNADAD